jgi:hypothetical protein
VFDNEYSFHLWKRHACTSTVERQLTDWREDVTTWCDPRGLLYSLSIVVCLLIRLNCIELQPSIRILIWGATFQSCIATPSYRTPLPSCWYPCFLCGESRVQISVRRPAVLTDVFHGFRQSFYGNDGYLKLGLYCFLLHLFQYVIH